MSRLILDSKFIQKSFAITAFLMISFVTSATINVTTPLPANLTLCQGNALNLSISATSDSTLEYTWKKNGTVVGTNSPIFSISSVTVADTGTYTCTIKEINTANVDEQICAVAINLPPMIITQTSGGVSPICEGSTINLNADVQNAIMIWRKDGAVLATNVNTYSITNASIADTGNYYVYARALPGCRDTTTNNFHQSIRVKGSITIQPKGTELRDNSNMSYVMRVSVAGDGPFAYQWLKDGTEVPGANSDSFKIFAYTTAGDSGSYRVIINTTAPCNDTLTSSLALIGPTLCPIILSQSDTLVYGCMQGVLHLEVKAVGVGRYQWFRNGTDSIPYASFPRYTVVPVDSSAASFYTCVTYRESTAPGSCEESEKKYKRTEVRVKPRQKITVQPLTNSSCSASTHTMSVAATDGNIYQWFKNNVAIPGATDSTYTVNPVTSTPDEYKVHVSNIYCTPEPSEKVLVRQIDPSTMVAIYDIDKLNLKEQCTDSMGWTYYAHDMNLQEMLFAIRKDTNKVHFRPEIKTTRGFVKELQPNEIENKGIMLGLRMFNLKIDSGEKITVPYDVKFYFNDGPLEAGQFLSQINARNNTVPGFSSNLPLNELSFVVSTHHPMDTGLINLQSKTPLNFPNEIVEDKSFGRDNNVKYVRINKLHSANGGGTFYFHYTRKGSVGIQPVTLENGVSIYPNPSNGNMTVVMGDMNKSTTTVTVSDYLGRIVHISAIAKNTVSKDLDYSNLPAGNYIVKMENGITTLNTKISIEK